MVSKATLFTLRRLHFSLVELLIVLFFIGIIAGLTGIKIKQAYDEQRFLTEVQQIASHLQMAQDIMLMMQNEVRVCFSRDPNDSAIRYQLKFEKPLPPQWLKILNKQYTLKSIKGLEFEDQNILFNPTIELAFFCRGMVMSRGRLLLSPKETTRFVELDRRQDYYIDLLGYPHFIESQKYGTFDRVEDPLRYLPSLDLYPPKIIEEIHEKKKKAA